LLPKYFFIIPLKYPPSRHPSPQSAISTHLLSYPPHLSCPFWTHLSNNGDFCSKIYPNLTSLHSRTNPYICHLLLLQYLCLRIDCFWTDLYKWVSIHLSTTLMYHFSFILPRIILQSYIPHHLICLFHAVYYL
jgi:hypothetical protein